MSEIKDREECYLIGWHLEHHHSVQKSQHLNADSETWSEKLRSFSKASKKNYVYHAIQFSNLLESRRRYYHCPYFVVEKAGHKTGETKGSYICTALLYTS